jgi:hypothetical protein
MAPQLFRHTLFDNSVQLETAVESPTPAGVSFTHVVTQWFQNAEGSGINHILNETGPAVSSANLGATLCAIVRAGLCSDYFRLRRYVSGICAATTMLSKIAWAASLR